MPNDLVAQPSWDDSFLEICRVVSLRSKDQSTKVGSVIVGPDNEIRSTGYNSFPRGMIDTLPERQERPLKYKVIEHAERNAIYNAARVGIPLKGCRIYIPGIACSDCSRAIVQSGIVEVITKNADCHARWAEDAVIALTILKECGVGFRVAGDFNPGTLQNTILRLSARQDFSICYCGEPSAPGLVVCLACSSEPL